MEYDLESSSDYDLDCLMKYMTWDVKEVETGGIRWDVGWNMTCNVGWDIT